jgi:hypothetical protein
LICATILAFLFGKVASYSYADNKSRGSGRQRRQGRAHAADRRHFVYAIYMVPVLGFVAWGAVTILAWERCAGRFGSFRREESPSYPARRLSSSPAQVLRYRWCCPN